MKTNSTITLAPTSGFWPRVLLMVLFFTLPASLTGFASEKIKMNKYCPVTTTELAEEQFSVDYNGQRIYFCCNKCKKDFLANSEVYLANVKYESEDQPAGTKPSDEATEHHDNSGNHEHNESGAVDKMTTSNHDESNNNEHAEGEEHDHATGHSSSSSFVTFLGKFHPMMTHFPIALILTAFLFVVLGFFWKSGPYDTISVYLLYIASLSSIVTVTLGLMAGAGASYPTFLADYFTTHRLLGITTGVFTLLTTYFGYRLLHGKQSEMIWIYRLSLLVTAILVGVTGHFGATLVFGPDYFNF